MGPARTAPPPRARTRTRARCTRQPLVGHDRRISTSSSRSTARPERDGPDEQDGAAPGLGPVSFAGDWEVENPIEQCDGPELDSREIRVRADKEKVAGAPAAKVAMLPSSPSTSVTRSPSPVSLPRNLLRHLGEALKAHRGGVGEITDVELLTRGKNNRLRPASSPARGSAAAGIQAWPSPTKRTASAYYRATAALPTPPPPATRA